MQNTEVNKVLNAWPPMARVIYVPHTEEEYDRLVILLDTLIDEGGENESHLLASLMEIVRVLIEREEKHVPELTT